MPEETTEQPKSFTLPLPVGVKALRTQMGGVPGVSDFAAQAKEIKTSKQAEEAGAAALQRQAQLGQEIGLTRQAQELNKARAERAIAQQERERAYAIEDEFAQKEKSLQTKFQPTKDTVETMAALFSVVGVLGMAMGGQGKDASTRALTAMNGMLEGWRKGRADLVKQQEKEFDKEMQRIKFELDKALRKAERSMRLLATDRKEAEALAAEANAELGSSIGKQLLEEQGVTAWYNYVTGSIQKSRQHAEALAAKERQHRETITAMTARRDEKAMQAIGPALRNIAEQYPEGTANTLLGASTEDKKRVQGSFRALEESESAADFVARNPKAVGALAVAKNFLRIDAIKSLKDDEDAAAVAVGKSQIIDQQLDQAAAQGKISKDDAEAAKVLQKKLFGLALADVQGSGQRGSVYLDRQFQNLYDQASRQETLLKIIRERADENNRNLRVYKLDVDRNMNPEKFPLTMANTPDSFNAYLRERTPAQAQIPEKVQKALQGKSDGTGARSGGKTYRIYGGVISETQE